MAKFNYDFFVSIDWMRYRSEWVPHRLLFADPYTYKTVDIRPDLGSLRYFTYQDVQVNLKYVPSLFRQEDWISPNVVRVPVEEFLKSRLVKEHLPFNENLWDLTIGTKDLATYMYLDRFIPDVLSYIGKRDNTAETRVRDMVLMSNRERKGMLGEIDEEDEDDDEEEVTQKKKKENNPFVFSFKRTIIK
ncbi:hypothetical protein TNCT_543781 [Trichonephila clavata]|uniref:Uncharacterized protein n=1 Tax=Trichonephila clavata TaxID=2740835 RepID=A0A8X6H6L4_TRICU|nr:hypothetical protein TNCT_543781 [Trichonephila clavata]